MTLEGLLESLLTVHMRNVHVTHRGARMVMHVTRVTCLICVTYVTHVTPPSLPSNWQVSWSESEELGDAPPPSSAGSEGAFVGDGKGAEKAGGGAAGDEDSRGRADSGLLLAPTWTRGQLQVGSRT